MIPDKIYFGYDEGVHLESYCLEKKGKCQLEYVRKEALLEWAKEAHDSGPIKDSADKGDAWSVGYLCGMRDIIDKLNTL